MLSLETAQLLLRNPGKYQLTLHLQESDEGLAFLAALAASAPSPADEQVTVFAPTNAAFTALLEAFDGEIPPEILAEVSFRRTYMSQPHQFSRPCSHMHAAPACLEHKGALIPAAVVHGHFRCC